MLVDISLILVNLVNLILEDTSLILVNLVLKDINSDPRDLNSALDKSKDIEIEDSTLEQPTIFLYKR